MRSLISIGLLGLIGLGSAVAALHAADQSAPPWQSPAWTQIETAMGSIGFDGTLKLSYPLVEIDGEYLGVRCTLEHRIELDAWGRAHSAWRFVGLESLLVPMGRDELGWLPLSGGVVPFERSKIGPSFKVAGASPWLIRERKVGEYDLSSTNGVTWHYIQGLLVAAEHSAIGEIHFASQGGCITRIFLPPEGAEPAQVLLQVEYSPTMQVTGLRAGTALLNAFQWDESGQLSSWRRADGSEVVFTYKDGLLAEVREAGKAPTRYSWQENPGANRGDSPWPSQVHLAADESRDYTFGVATAGIVIGSRVRATGLRTSTTMNLLRRRVEQRAGTETLLVTLRQGTTAARAIERVENGQGDILEDYHYDARGQLIGIKRRGGLEWTLHYDETGKLTAVEKGEIGK